MEDAPDVGPAVVDRTVNETLRRDRSSAGDPLAGEIDRADIFRVGENSGEPRIDQKGLGPGDARAQMAGAG